MSGRVCGVLLGLGGLLLVALLALALPARAAGPGVVAGRLVNGTAGGSRPAGAEVVLHAFRGDAHETDRVGRADERGAFRFDGLDVGEELAYELTATYADVTYRAAPARLTAEAPARELELAVYETTAVDPGLRATRALLVLGAVDAERQEIGAMELLILDNPSDRTFAPRPDGPAGPMGLVRFGLPPGARDLQPQLGLDPTRVLQVDRGFASTAPIPPGAHEVGFAYRVPYTGEHDTLDKSLPYGAGLLQVLVPLGGPELSNPALSQGEPVELGGRRFRVWTGRELAAGTRLALELRGLPTRPPWRALLDAVAQPIVVPGLFGLVLVIGALWAWRGRRWPRADACPPAATAEPLLQTLADLDDAFASGAIDEPAHRERRAALKADLRRRLASGHGLPAAPEEARHG